LKMSILIMLYDDWMITVNELVSEERIRMDNLIREGGKCYGKKEDQDNVPK